MNAYTDIITLKLNAEDRARLGKLADVLDRLAAASTTLQDAENAPARPATPAAPKTAQTGAQTPVAPKQDEVSRATVRGLAARLIQAGHREAVTDLIAKHAAGGERRLPDVPDDALPALYADLAQLPQEG